MAADALRLPYADASFDAVTISFGLRNVEDTVSRPARDAPGDPAGRDAGGLRVLHADLAPFRTVYANYLVAAIPRIASLVSSNPVAYEYLAESIQAWPDQAALAEVIAAAGWREVEWRNLSGGIVALHRAACLTSGPGARGPLSARRVRGAQLPGQDPQRVRPHRPALRR